MLKVTLPKVGQTMSGLIIARWLKAEGDAIAQGDNLLEIKAGEESAPVAATQAGVLRKALRPEGTRLMAGAPVAILSEDGEDIAAALAEAETEVKKAEIMAAEPVRKRMSPMRKAIARNLLASKQNIPHWYIQRIIDAGPMMAFYKAEKAKYPCSVNDVITLACSRVIMEFPAYRCRVDGDDTLEFPSANIGVAVGLDDGLVVPVILGVEQMSLEQLGVESKRVAELARKRRIEGMGYGVFTISNLGMFGVDQFTAIINPPEAAILAVSAVREDVIVKDGVMRAGRTLSLTLSADHRLIDGVQAAKFMARLTEILQAPEQLLG